MNLIYLDEFNDVVFAPQPCIWHAFCLGGFIGSSSNCCGGSFHLLGDVKSSFCRQDKMKSTACWPESRLKGCCSCKAPHQWGVSAWFMASSSPHLSWGFTGRPWWLLPHPKHFWFITRAGLQTSRLHNQLHIDLLSIETILIFLDQSFSHSCAFLSWFYYTNMSEENKLLVLAGQQIKF